MNIEIDDLSGSEIYELLQEHLQSALLHSPPESVHALDVEGLRKPAEQPERQSPGHGGYSQSPKKFAIPERRAFP